MATILLVEDNSHIMKINLSSLEMRHYRVLGAETLQKAEELLKKNQVDLIILDVLLPDGNGVAWCSEIKAQYNIPILFLSALGENSDIIAGLKAGGDDYLAKPYDLEVLMAHVQARLRCSSTTGSVIRFGQLSLDTQALCGYLNGQDLMLTQKEFALLQLLIKNRDQVVRKETILKQIWGSSDVSESNLLYIVISRLKKKLKSDETGITISVKRPVGYCIELL